ncbi:MAG: hypothetical protein K6A96_09840 [Prevotella sp.]|nr:hypothetical protein [Prevotella sp.]
MRKISIIIVFALLGISAMAQKLTFHSAEFEMGVKMHLGLGENDDVQQSQADTIISINLSGLGIKDIRDVIYLPNVEILNLSNNGITNTFPLTVLDSLRLLDLCNNELESINPLVFSNADKMQVLIAYNYISDFSYFLTPAKCQITLVGMNLQQVKDAPYFDVYQLYADVDETGTVVRYRGFTNMEAGVTLNCGSLSVPAVMDGNTNSVTLPDNLDTAMQVILSNGEKGDTTWVVPPKILQVAEGETITIETGLPDTYTISSSYVILGTTTIDGTRINYTAPADFEYDVLFITYYEGRRLRGFTMYQIQNSNAVLTGDVNNDGHVTITDAVAVVNRILGNASNGFVFKAADINGDGKITITDAVGIVNIILNK